MNEEPTRKLPDARSFEERVFARFDSIDARLGTLEARSYDTKPIWERALAAIMEMGLEVGEIKTKVGVIEGKVGVIDGNVGVIEEKVGVIDGKVGVIDGKVGVIEGKVGVIEEKVETIENEISAIKTDQRTMRNELIDVRREVKHHIGDRIAMILKFLLEDREDIRDAEGRIRELESKMA